MRISTHGGNYSERKVNTVQDIVGIDSTGFHSTFRDCCWREVVK